MRYAIRIAGTDGSVREVLRRPIRGLRATWQGALWVQRRGEEPWDDEGPIDVFGADRLYIGTFAVGDTMMPTAFGPDGLAAFRETDESGAATIVVRRSTEETR